MDKDKLYTYSIIETRETLGWPETRQHQQVRRVKARSAREALKSPTFFNPVNGQGTIEKNVRTLDIWIANPQGFPWPVKLRVVLVAVREEY
jgi:hypothetical protein